MRARYFSEKIVEWYQNNKRDLPWRNTKDPYKVWLSEIILQQTRVNQGLPYYTNFIKTFPTVESLASAPLQKILRLWQGLGYYTRARNLHACAKQVVTHYHGAFPDTFEELRMLPGIGDYTAAAIASICFHESVAVVDGNVFRVLARVLGIETPLNTTQGKKQFTALANELISPENPAEHNQAMMEFGALYCTPKNPDCTNCIFQASCIANKSNLQDVLPVKLKGKSSINRYFYYFVICNDQSMLMKPRTGNDIWKGLYDFYLIEKSRSGKISDMIEADTFLKKLKWSSVVITRQYKHKLSHQTILCKFVVVQIPKRIRSTEKVMRFYPAKKINNLPKPVLISRFLDDFHLLKFP